MANGNGEWRMAKASGNGERRMASAGESSYGITHHEALFCSGRIRDPTA
ncbi:MAG: hypothetical protein ABIG63_18320 [Chloroflexota bacterium]